MSTAIRDMFDGIAGKYDFLNHFLSAGRDIAWRNKAAKLVADRPHKDVLDLCGGTGDFLHSLSKSGINEAKSIIGDFSFGMLKGARAKFESYPCAQLDALNLPFKEESFDVVTCGYGMRNLDSLEKGMEEVRGVLKPGGVFITLEFFRPENLLTRSFYHGLAPLFIPVFGGLFSGSKSSYVYLVESVKKFLSVKAYAKRLEELGYQKVQILSCDMGISHIVYAERV